MIDKLTKWFKTTLKIAIWDNWSEVLCIILALYGWILDDQNLIFGFSFWIMLVYWIFWRVLGISTGFKRK